jgi:hypothetical protein
MDEVTVEMPPADGSDPADSHAQESRPSFALARRRAKAMTGFKDEEGKDIPLLAPISDLGRGGLGVELFFRTIVWTTGVFALLSAVGSISLADNVAANAGLYGPRSIAATAIGPCCRRTAGALYGVHAVPWVVIFLIMLAYLYFIRWQQRAVARSLDAKMVTASDYAIKVKGLPPQGASARHLRAHFSQYGKVAQVTVGYACATYVELLDKWKSLELDWRERSREIADRRAAGVNVGPEAEAELQELVAGMEAAEESMREIKRHGRKPTGIAFVTFDTERGKARCLRAHELTVWGRIAEILTRRAITPRYAGNKRIEVRVAPEPSDVYWENLEVPRRRVLLRSLATDAVSGVLIGLSATALIFLNRWKDATVARLLREGGTADTALINAFATGISVLTSVIVAVINVCLALAIGRLTLLERRSTKTDHEESLYFKLAGAYIFNTVLLILLVQPDPSRWFDEGGVYSQALFIAFSSIVPELNKVARVDLWARRLALSPFANSQAVLDRLWEPPASRPGEYYAALTKTIAVGLVYGPAMPVVWFISLFNLGATYWSNKYALLRVNKQPPMMDAGLSEQFRIILGLLVLASAALMYVVLDTTLDGVRGPVDAFTPLTASMLGVWGLYFLMPLSIFPCLRYALRGRSVRAGDGGRG